MKKSNRIRKNEDFKKIYNNKRYYSSSNLVLYVAPRKEEHSRVGISVSKKLGNAVQRNKIKRQVRMMVINLFKFDEKFDTIILVRENYKKDKYETNEKYLENLYKKVKI